MNSGKDPLGQTQVCADLETQILAGNWGIHGIMLESHLVGGNQVMKPLSELRYGKSVTDACLALDATADLLAKLSSTVAIANG
ncbi:MAG: 3-deoxy-7-phosphoheptulonate synthase [Halieaceae bacterium]